jgi:hypothetical protein
VKWIYFYCIQECFYLLPNCPTHSIQQEKDFYLGYLEEEEEDRELTGRR